MSSFGARRSGLLRASPPVVPPEQVPERSVERPAGCGQALSGRRPRRCRAPAARPRGRGRRAGSTARAARGSRRPPDGRLPLPERRPHRGARPTARAGRRPTEDPDSPARISTRPSGASSGGAAAQAWPRVGAQGERRRHGAQSLADRTRNRCRDLGERGRQRETAAEADREQVAHHRQVALDPGPVEAVARRRPAAEDTLGPHGDSDRTCPGERSAPRRTATASPRGHGDEPPPTGPARTAGRRPACDPAGAPGDDRSRRRRTDDAHRRRPQKDGRGQHRQRDRTALTGHVLLPVDSPQRSAVSRADHAIPASSRPTPSDEQQLTRFPSRSGRATGRRPRRCPSPARAAEGRRAGRHWPGAPRSPSAVPGRGRAGPAGRPRRRRCTAASEQPVRRLRSAADRDAGQRLPQRAGRTPAAPAPALTAGTSARPRCRSGRRLRPRRERPRRASDPRAARHRARRDRRPGRRVGLRRAAGGAAPVQTCPATAEQPPSSAATRPVLSRAPAVARDSAGDERRPAARPSSARSSGANARPVAVRRASGGPASPASGHASNAPASATAARSSGSSPRRRRAARPSRSRAGHGPPSARQPASTTHQLVRPAGARRSPRAAVRPACAAGAARRRGRRPPGCARPCGPDPRRRPAPPAGPAPRPAGWRAGCRSRRRARCSGRRADRPPRAPRTSPTTSRSGRMRSACRTRSRRVTSPAALDVRRPGAAAGRRAGAPG